MAVITIDGIRLEVPDNKNVLECALDAGIYIPHLCHHKDLSPLGSCRMCVVEVEGQEGATTSCTLKAKDGMVIHTKTPELEKLRMLADFDPVYRTENRQIKDAYKRIPSAGRKSVDPARYEPLCSLRKMCARM